MFRDNSGLTKDGLLTRLIFDVSIGVGVAAFAASMWGVPSLVQLLVSASIGVGAALLCFALLLLASEVIELFVPERSKKRRKERARRLRQESSVRQQAQTSPPSPPANAAKPMPPQETPPPKTHGPYSVTEVEPRTVSIAAEPLPTPPFPEEWSEQLIETLEWRVFDDLCIAFWEAQGNTVIDHSKGSSEAASFFISAKNRSGIKIGIVQSRSSQANKASVIEMKNLLRLKQQSDLPIAIFMYAGRISNVVSSYCQSHGIRLFGSHSINKGIQALSAEKQAELLKELIRPDYMIPTCPNCRIKMVKRKRRDTGRIFWGCLSYPECRETIEYSPYF
ncbi:MAG: topoisomerase DNA-binding C4 zinc finger domain-containing protein [Arenicella sp.]|nr:topoisomerase DNA-binding C4 zinc finger domain-containing protein [Arenicella sp.]